MQWLFAAVLALAPEAAPEGDPAQLIREGDYAGAAAAFGRRYEETGDPALLFGQAQALRRAGDCRAAIEVFERFVATEPPAADVAAATDAIQACREILREHEPTVEPTPAPEPTPMPTRPPPRPWYTDRAGGVLVGLGAAIAITGAGLFGASYARLAERPSSEAGYEDRRRVVNALWGSGLGLLAAGGALIVSGAIRWGVVAKRRAQTRNQPRVAIAPGSALTIRF
jgi:hypothetical protein